MMMTISDREKTTYTSVSISVQAAISAIRHISLLHLLGRTALFIGLTRLAVSKRLHGDYLSLPDRLRHF